MISPAVVATRRRRLARNARAAPRRGDLPRLRRNVRRCASAPRLHGGRAGVAAAPQGHPLRGNPGCPARRPGPARCAVQCLMSRVQQTVGTVRPHADVGIGRMCVRRRFAEVWVCPRASRRATCSRCWRGAREVAGGARRGEWGAQRAYGGHSFGDKIACVDVSKRRKIKE
jgi:hypothetical protein